MEQKNMEPTEQLADSYEVPEMIDLGDASQLTLGGEGCRNDGKVCLMSEPFTEI